MTETFEEAISSLPPVAQSLIAEIIESIKKLEGVEGKKMQEGSDKKAVLAFNLGDIQLFHLRFESEKQGTPVVGTVPIDVFDFEPLLLDSHNISGRLKKQIAGEKVQQTIKLVSFPLNNADEVEEFLELIQLKYEYYKFGGE